LEGVEETDAQTDQGSRVSKRGKSVPEMPEIEYLQVGKKKGSSRIKRGIGWGEGK